MDPKLLLVKIITLLYKESCLPDKSSASNLISKNIINTIKFPETGMDFDRSRETIQLLRSTALWMCENPTTITYDRVALLQRIRVNTTEDESLYYAIEQGIDVDVDETILKKQCMEVRHDLRTFLDQLKIKEILKKASQAVIFNPESINWKSFVREVHADLEPYTTSASEDKLEGMVEEIDISNLDGVNNLLSRAISETSNEGILRTGLQGINRMTGDHKGFRRGEFIVVSALQHNYKSGFVSNIFKQVALYNKPHMRDPTKKPCLLHISVEDELPLNILSMYANLKENETGVECDIKNIDFKAATKYVHERLSVNGYSIKMCRFNPTDMTYHTFFDLITNLEAEGYEIHLIVFDYLNMISKKGCANEFTGSSTRDLFRRIRNFTGPRGITFITPHQLSTEAKSLLRQGVDNFVKEIANKGYYDSCRTLDQEVDLELYLHIVKMGGASYLTVQRGKHRKVKITPEKDLYCVIPFHPVGGILDDINGPDSSRKHVGNVTDSGSDTPWWEAA